MYENERKIKWMNSAQIRKKVKRHVRNGKTQTNAATSQLKR